MATGTTAITQNTAYTAIKVPKAVGRGTSFAPSRLRSIEVGLDVMTSFVAIELAYYSAAIVDLHLSLARPTKHFHLAVFFVSVILAVLLDRAGAYRIGGSLLGIRETACVLEAIFYATIVLLPCALLINPNNAFRVGLVAVTFLALLLIVQKQTYCAFLLRIRPLRVGLERVVVYGQAESAIPLLEALLRSPKIGFVPTACFCDALGADSERAFRRKSPQVNLYSSDQFSEDLLRGEEVDLVVIASPLSSSEKLKYVLEQSERAGSTILFGAEPHTLGTLGIEYLELDGQLLYGIHTSSKRALYDRTKRVLDIMVASGLLFLAGGPMLLAAMAIALDTRGPVLFKQTRIGLHGKPFTIFKFRTMHMDMCGYKVSPFDSSDPRITRIGRWLRKSSIDELPQLFNILRGEMTLVGPRPEMPFIVATYSDTQMQRLAVKPGLTGVWQISEDRRYPIHENIHYDLYYLKHRSTFIDIALILHTVLLAVRGI
jgi:exopolysaccharide biosynthesis polyprenyl glycosylphosphotransferase